MASDGERAQQRMLIKRAVRTLTVTARYDWPRGWRCVISWAHEGDPAGAWDQVRFFDLVPGELCDAVCEQLELVLSPDRNQVPNR